MSQEKVVLVREALSQINNGEPVDVLSPDIVVEVRAGPEQGIYRGIAEVAHYFGRYFGTWNDFRVVVDEVVEAGDDKVSSASATPAEGD